MIAAWIIAETGVVNTVLGFFSRGGLFMWPLLACSIVSVTIMILRGLALLRKKIMPPIIEHEIERLAPGESLSYSWNNGFWRRINPTVPPTPPQLSN